MIKQWEDSKYQKQLISTGDYLFKDCKELDTDDLLIKMVIATNEYEDLVRELFTEYMIMETALEITNEKLKRNHSSNYDWNFKLTSIREAKNKLGIL